MAPLASPIVLGAPGIYQTPPTPIHALTGVRMDVCAFAGVAPRGPARAPLFDAPWAPQPCGGDVSNTSSVQLAVPVPVESWSAYTQIFGAFEGPGLLPYAVAAFFENGGRRAYIVRIVHRYLKADGVTADETRNWDGVARFTFAGLKTTGGHEVRVSARSDGSWANRLQATLTFAARALALGAGDFFPDRLRLPLGVALEQGATVRLFLGLGAKVIRRITTIVEDWNPATGERERWAWFDAPAASAANAVEIIEGTLTVDDRVNPVETLEHIGLSSVHPRWLAKSLVLQSSLLYPWRDSAQPQTDWMDADLAIDPDLSERSLALIHDGLDRYADITPEDFFDPDWVFGNECPGCGVHALTDLEDLSLLVVPDLYSPGPVAAIEPIVEPPSGSAEFAECVTVSAEAQGLATGSLTGLQLDPTLDLETIASLQQRLVDLADSLEQFTVLLDVPPHLSRRRTLYWRAKFDSAYAAAYHPWLRVARPDDRRDSTPRVNPSAFAAGIIAQRENQVGVPYGPANVIAAGVVAVDDVITRPRHDELHQNAINVYMPERDGVRLTAGRTLSLDQTWRQLSVRRLVTMIRRALDQQMQWAVFEPNNQRLRFQISRALESFLRQLYRANAFVGATEDEAFFVKCDDRLNSREVEQAGQLLAQIGVAPAEPLEFIVLDLARDGDSFVIAEAD